MAPPEPDERSTFLPPIAADADGDGHRSGAGGGDGGAGESAPARPRPVRPRAARPTPARAIDDTAPEPRLEIEEETLDVDGVRWTVRVTGRAGAGEASAPLLLLGFWSDEAESGDVPEREALVPGTTLQAMGEGMLRQALGRSRVPPPVATGPLPERDRRRSGGRGRRGR